MKPNDQSDFLGMQPGLRQLHIRRQSLTESGVPQLKVFIFNTGYGHRCVLQRLCRRQSSSRGLSQAETPGLARPHPGNHTVTETQTSRGFITGGLRCCDVTGKVTLNSGDNNTCSIIDIASGACPTGQHCAPPRRPALAASPAAFRTPTACQPLCSTGFNKCCGARRSPTEGATLRVVKSPPQACK